VWRIFGERWDWNSWLIWISAGLHCASRESFGSFTFRQYSAARNSTSSSRLSKIHPQITQINYGICVICGWEPTKKQLAGSNNLNRNPENCKLYPITASRTEHIL